MVDELSYIGGFFDGEACFSIKRAKRKKAGYYDYVPEVAVASVSKEHIEWLRTQIGGKILPRTPKNKRWKRFYLLRFTKLQDALTVCQTLLPFLRLKKPQAELIIKWCQLRLARKPNYVRGWHGYIKSKGLEYTEQELEIPKLLQVLNRKGREAPNFAYQTELNTNSLPGCEG